jgi:hypothetical protein
MRQVLAIRRHCPAGSTCAVEMQMIYMCIRCTMYIDLLDLPLVPGPKGYSGGGVAV